MKLKAMLVRIIADWDMIKASKGKFVPKGKVIFENWKKFSDLRLGVEDENRLFIAKSHFRDKESGSYDLHHLVFDLVELEEKESKHDFSIKYSPVKSGEFERELIYDEKLDIFYDAPILKKLKGKDWEYSNSLKDASLGTISTGVFYLNVYLRGSKEPINSSPYKVCVLPSSMSLGDYENMVNDILNIKRELLISDEKGAKQSLQVRWTHGLDEIERAIAQIKLPLMKIDENPKVKLVNEWGKLPLKNIKKFNHRTILDIAMQQGSTKHLAQQPSQDTDIYEHRMIKYALMKLKKYVSDSEELLGDKFKKLEQYVLEDEDNLLRLYKANNLEELKNFVGSFWLYREAYYERIQNDMDTNVDYEDTVEAQIRVMNYGQGHKCNVVFMEGKFQTEVAGAWSVYDGFSTLDYENGEMKYRYKMDNGEITEWIPIKSRMAKIKLASNSPAQHLLLVNKLFSYCPFQEIVTIHCRVKRNNFSNRDLLRGHKIRKNNGDFYDKTYDYTLNIVDLISINGEKPLNNMVSLKSLYIRYGRLPVSEEINQQINEIEEKKKKILYDIESFKKVSPQAKRIREEIERILNLDFFKGVKYTKNQWRLTQIFINDRNYSRVFNTLRGLDRRYEFTSEPDAKDIVVKKTDKLYEYWVFIRMLYILTEEQQWVIKGNTGLVKLVKDFLKSRKTGSSENLEGLEVQLSHPGYGWFGRINMTVSFNRVLENRKNPDYVIEIYNDSETIWKRFILDAKYRNYADLGEYNAFMDDINTVAIEKYINSFTEPLPSTAASFILHSHPDDRYIYFGGHFTPKLHDNLVPIHDDEDCNPKHRFGSFYCLPDKTAQLKKFIKMILEYHFVEQDLSHICWECGSTDVDRIEKTTAGGYPKYYITCRHCKTFWVRTHCVTNGHKLVKHGIHNYHTEENNGYPWYVKCPVCDYIYESAGDEFQDILPLIDYGVDYSL